MTPEYILRKSMCRAPHCSGPYELREVPLAEWPESERENLRKRMAAEIECMDRAREYAEPGYSDPDKEILFANWNHFPNKVCDILESYGFSIEWNDEWTTCDGCGKALRTSPDSYGWQPSYLSEEDGYYCADCMTADSFDGFIDDPSRAVNMQGLDLKRYGFAEIQCGFESGWHPGQNDNPKKIHADLVQQGYRNILFQVSEASQFYIGFCVWHKPAEGSDYDPDKLYQWYADDESPFDGQCRPYLLIDSDCAGYLEVLRRDSHPACEDTGSEQVGLTDDIALAVCEQDADSGDEDALRLIMAHEYDKQRLADHFGYSFVRTTRFY